MTCEVDVTSTAPMGHIVLTCHEHGLVFVWNDGPPTLGMLVERWDKHVAEQSSLTVSRDLLESLVSEESCWFDHHGGCQEHGYLTLEAGELCPQMELKQLLGLA